jgi:hypothetical protein
MNWPELPYPPGVQPPGIGFILSIGGIIFCYLGIVIYLTVKAAFAQVSPPPPASPDNPASSAARHYQAETGGQGGQLRP